MSHCEAKSLRRWQTQWSLVYGVANHKDVVYADPKHYYWYGLVCLRSLPAANEADSEAHTNGEND